MSDKIYYTKAELCALTGSTQRQLAWWDEQKLVVPGWDKMHRAYSPQEALEVAAIMDLRKKGVSLQRIRFALRRLRRVDLRTGDLFMLLPVRGKGKEVLFHLSERDAMEAAAKCPAALYVLHVGELVRSYLPELPTAGIGNADGEAPSRVAV